jgi:hypothetical protein
VEWLKWWSACLAKKKKKEEVRRGIWYKRMDQKGPDHERFYFLF